MKRIAISLGVAAALAVPSVASAGANPQVVAQVKPQVRAQVVDAQIANALVAKRMIAHVQIAKAMRVDTARVTARRAAAFRLTVLHRAR